MIHWYQIVALRPHSLPLCMFGKSTRSRNDAKYRMLASGNLKQRKLRSRLDQIGLLISLRNSARVLHLYLWKTARLKDDQQLAIITAIIVEDRLDALQLVSSSLLTADKGH